MKLAQSLAVYGLIAIPPRKKLDLPNLLTGGDFWNWRNITAGSVMCQERIARLITRFDYEMLGEDLCTIVEIMGAPGLPSDGLRFRDHQREHMAQLEWQITDEVRDRHDWGCGWVESAYRRWMTDTMLDHLPARLQVLVPAQLSEWAT